MYLDNNPASSRNSRRISSPSVRAWSVLLPFFNEREFLTATIASLAAQSVPMKLILIDNGSIDDSVAIARAACRDRGIDFLLVTEPRPGKVAALQTGLSRVRTRWVATCDADTIYPPHYLASAETILTKPGCVAAGAYFVPPEDKETKRKITAYLFLAVARLLPRQSHAGGAGQAFCTAALRAVGGFDAARWNYVLEDHEIIHRMTRNGRIGYAHDLWCAPSQRERDRDSIRWTLIERLVYTAAAARSGDWYFYSFLAARLSQRRLLSNRIRERQFHHLEGPAFVPPHPVF